MARQVSSKVTETMLRQSVQPVDLDGLPTSIPDRNAEQTPEAAPSILVQGEANRDLRHGMIREAAYHLYAQRGYVDGFELADWLQAEAEGDRLLSGRTTTN